jgi:hypothetical protein
MWNTVGYVTWVLMNQSNIMIASGKSGIVPSVVSAMLFVGIAPIVP